MKQLYWAIVFGFVFCALGFAPPAQAKVKKKAVPTPTRSAVAKKSKPNASARAVLRSSTKPARVSAKAGKRGRHARVAAAPPVATWRRGQMEPTADRYKEIQQALASKGYLKSEPSGSWDAASQDAMRRFQADQKLDQSGTITARSLSALGLGAPPAAPQ